MLLRLRSLTSLGIYFLIISIICICVGGSITIKENGEIVDYHSLTTETAEKGQLVKGTIDEWYGPVATDNTSDYYFLLLDNGQIIIFETSDSSQKEILESANYASVDPATIVPIELEGNIKVMYKEDQEFFISILLSEGYTYQEAQELLVPYYLVNYPNWADLVVYGVAFIFLLMGVFVLLLKFKVLGKSKKTNYTPTNQNYGAGFPTYYGDTQKNYRGYQGANSYSDYQTNSQSQYDQQNIYNSQHTAPGQNRTYTNNQYTAPGQNRQYTNNQYTAPGQNRQYTNNQYTAPGQNRQYANNQYDVPGQNRTYTNSRYTASGQNRHSINSHQNVQNSQIDNRTQTQHSEYNDIDEFVN